MIDSIMYALYAMHIIHVFTLCMCVIYIQIFGIAGQLAAGVGAGRFSECSCTMRAKLPRALGGVREVV